MGRLVYYQINKMQKACQLKKSLIYFNKERQAWFVCYASDVHGDAAWKPAVEAVDLGYNVVSLHYNEGDAKEVEQELRDEWIYPNLSPSQFFVGEYEVI